MNDMSQNKIENWEDFLKKLEIAKTYGIKGLKVDSICKLIYYGSFDSLIGSPELSKELLPKYNEMFEQVKKILRSKVNLPKANKTEAIGLDKVKTLAHLSFWRWQSSPIYRFSMADFYKSELGMEGFTEVKIPQEPLITYVQRNEDITKNKLLIENWSDVFLPENRKWFDLASARQRRMYVMGFVQAVEKRSYGALKDKAMIKVTIFTGKSMAEGLVLWQDRDTGEFPTKMKLDLTKGNLCLVQFIPSDKNGFRGGSIQWTKVLA